MGALDDLKAKAQKLARDRGEQIKKGLDKAGDLADTKTGRKHSGKVRDGVGKAKGFVDKLSEQGKGTDGGTGTDPVPDTAPPPPPPPPTTPPPKGGGSQ